MLKKTIMLWLLPLIVSAQATVPDSLKVPDGTQRVLALHAKGDQIYQCTEQEGEFAWQLQKPYALLFDSSGQLVGSHTEGAAWKYKDGSHLKAQVLEKADVTPDNSVEWLLLQASETQGKGLLTTARFIQRINTRGGLPPSYPCDNTHLGEEKAVIYAADYLFYGDKLSDIKKK